MAQQWVVQQHITTREGLPQNTIRDLHYDKYGYLWLATEAGLARWDGKTVRSITQKDAPDLLQSGRILAINDDDRGRMVVLTEGHPRAYLSLNGPFSFHKEQVSEDSYYWDQEYHFFHLDSLYATPEAAGLSDLKERVKELGPGGAFSNDGHTGIVLAAGKIICFDGHHAIIRPGPSVKNDKLFLLGNSLFGLKSDHELYRIDPDNIHRVITGGSFCHYLKNISSLVKKQLQIYCFQGPPLIYDGSEVYVLSNKNGIPEARLLARSLHFPGLVKMIYNEATGVLAVGTTTDGLYQLERSHFETIHPAHGAEIDADDYAEDIVYAMLPFSKDHVLTNRGLLSLNGDGSFLGIAEAHTLALGCWNGHYILNVHDGTVLTDSPFNLPGRRKLISTTEWVWQYESRKKDSTLLVLYLQRLARYSFKTGQYDTVLDGAPKDNELRCMMRYNDSMLLIGTWKGMLLINEAGKTAKAISYFKGINIRSFYRDRRGCIWIGTIGKGFYSWNGHSFNHYPMDRMNNLGTVHAFLEDGLGYLWVTTNNGLFRYLLKDLYHYNSEVSNKLFYNYFDQSNGLTGNEFNYAAPCSLALEDGRIAFSSMKGVVIITPNNIPFHNPQVKVNIDQVIVDSMTLYSPKSGTLSIAANTEQVQFDISTPYAGNPYELQLFYRLSGGNEDWNIVPEDGKISFNRLRKGDYRIAFRIVRSGGDAYESFAFTVLPLWYETTLARIIFALAILLLGIIAYLLGTRALRRQKARLEVQVDERTRGLNTTVVQLNDTITRLRNSEEELYHSQKQREKFSAMVLHDLQSPLRFLAGIADQLYQKLTAGKPEELNRMAFELKLSTRQVTEFSNDYLNWLKSNTGNEKEKEWVDARKILERVCVLFTELARSKNNVLSCKPGKELILFTIPDYLEIIIRNLVDNANKHTSQGMITLECNETGGLQQIRITDTGEGIDPAGLELINQLFAGEDVVLKSSSLGLQIVHDLLAKCNGSIKADSILGKGTVIMLTFPPVQE